MVFTLERIAQYRTEPSYYTLPDFFRILEMSARRGSGKEIGEHVCRPADVLIYSNPLAPSKCGCDTNLVIYKLISTNDISCEITFMWMPQDLGRIFSGHGLVPGSKSLHKPMLTNIQVVIWR